MRTGLTLCGLALLSLATGCVYSTQPLYTPERVKQDFDLAGTWEVRGIPERGTGAETTDFDRKRPIIIKALGEGEFEARWNEVLADSPLRGVQRTARLRVVDLNGFTYLDIDGIELTSDSPDCTTRDLHQIYAVRVIGESLILAKIDRKKLLKCATKANLRFSDGWGLSVLDAPTDELQKFIAGHREIFEACSVARRIEKPQAVD
jgi:hypothetical protein